MAKQLKTTGMAARAVMLIMVDPDTGTVKDFASSTVTSTMQVGANVTVGDLTWDGVTQKYFRNGSGTTDADFIKFVTNKPGFTVGAGSTQFTLVALVQAENATTRVMGTASQDYFFSLDSGSGGSTYPRLYIASNAFTAGLSAIAVGAKKLFGFNINRSGSGNWFEAFDTDSTINSGSLSFSAIDKTWTLDYVGRRNDSTSNARGYFVAIGIFTGNATSEELGALRDDPAGYLLETAGGITGALAATEAADVSAITGDVIITGTLAATEAADVAAFSGGSTPVTGDLDATEASDTAAATGTVRNPRLVIGPLKNNTGTLLANETGATVYVYQTSGAHVVTKTSQTSNGSGVMTVTDGALVSGTTYRYVIVLGSGAEGMDKSAAA